MGRVITVGAVVMWFAKMPAMVVRTMTRNAMIINMIGTAKMLGCNGGSCDAIDDYDNYDDIGVDNDVDVDVGVDAGDDAADGLYWL